MTSALNKLPDGTIELTITIPRKRVSKSYDKIVQRLAETVELKGFRKGKAPKKLVKEKLDKNKVYEEVLKELIPQVYVEVIKEHKLTPIINPRVQVVSLEEGKDWVIKAVTCELPKVKLGDYKGAVGKTLAAEKIWTPGKDATADNAISKKSREAGEGAEKRDKRLGKIFDALLETVKVEVPAMLIEDEINRMLSRLLDQTNRLGLTVEQYLASVGKTSEQLRAEYRKTAEEQIKLELILSAIADEQGVKIKEAEVEAMIKATPDEKARQALDTPAQRAYIRQILRKRAIIDNLLKL